MKQKLAEKAKMEDVANQVCRIQGHRIGVLQVQKPNQVPPNPKDAFYRKTVPVEKVICLACGATLEEIRGEE